MMRSDVTFSNQPKRQESMGKNKALFDEEEEEETIQINEDFAKKYDERKTKEMLKNKTSYSLFQNEAEGSDESSEDEHAEELTPELDNQIQATLEMIRNKDPRIYDPNFTPFSSTSSTKKGDKPKESKPVHYQDLLVKRAKSGLFVSFPCFCDKNLTTIETDWTTKRTKPNQSLTLNSKTKQNETLNWLPTTMGKNLFWRRSPHRRTFSLPRLLLQRRISFSSTSMTEPIGMPTPFPHQRPPHFSPTDHFWKMKVGCPFCLLQRGQKQNRNLPFKQQKKTKKRRQKSLSKPLASATSIQMQPILLPTRELSRGV